MCVCANVASLFRLLLALNIVYLSLSHVWLWPSQYSCNSWNDGLLLSQNRMLLYLKTFMKWTTNTMDQTRHKNFMVQSVIHKLFQMLQYEWNSREMAPDATFTVIIRFDSSFLGRIKQHDHTSTYHYPFEITLHTGRFWAKLRLLNQHVTGELDCIILNYKARLCYYKEDISLNSQAGQWNMRTHCYEQLCTHFWKTQFHKF